MTGLETLRTKWLALRCTGLALCASVLLSSACNSGLDAYNKDEDDGVDEEDQGDVGEVPVVDAEECATLCALAIDSADSALGCETTCGVDVWPDFSGVAGAYVTVLAGGGAAGQLDGGESCDLVSVCPDQGPCVESYGLCLEAAYNPEQVEYCAEEYAECASEELCYDAYELCQADVDAMLEECLNSGTPIETCEEMWEEASSHCICLLNACEQESDASECDDPEEEQPPPLPMPQQTGPRSFRIPRELLDAHLQRLHQLDTQIMLVPVRDAKTGDVAGLRLRSVEPGDPLFSIGLRNDDVLLAANGMPVLDLVTDLERLQQMHSASQITLKIRRRGIVQQLTYQLVDR
jgi:hypothetical protein